MSTELTHTNGNGVAMTVSKRIEQVLISGDLSNLDAVERVQYNAAVCESCGLNPLTNPFQYIKLNGKLVLYASRGCTDQLRKVHKVALTITAREKFDEIYVVTARATTPDGRTDESTGAVTLQGLRGEALANALMKAETKAKRRVTLSICGLGLLDETEVETIPGAQRDPGPAGYYSAQSDTIQPLTNEQGGVRPAVVEPEPYTLPENPWTHCLQGKSQYTDQPLFLLEEDVFKKIVAPKTLSKFATQGKLTPADVAAIMAANADWSGRFAAAEAYYGSEQDFSEGSSDE